MRFRAALLIPLVALTACATQAPPPTAPMPTPPATTAPPASSTVAKPAAPIPPQLRDISAARADFVRETAAKYALDPAYIESVLAKAQIRDGIIAAMSRPAEAVKPWSAYRPIFITQKRIDDGKAFMAANREALAHAEARYGVPAEIITAIIGVETSYGGNKGSYPVIDALYTLAFNYPRTGDPAKAARENAREAFFRDELAQFFALGKETGLDITTLKGSYAGAMGYGQFMPSSYRQYAVDGNADGTRDLFNSIDDAVESVANYFVGKGGWVRGGTVMLPALRDANAPDYNAQAIEATKPVDAFALLGYRPPIAVPGDAPVQVVRFAGAGGTEYWMVFDNFRAITKYNTSRMYATAVYQLAESIAGRDAQVAQATQQATVPAAPVQAEATPP
ncbi:lytic murein transglycosylase B [Lysobacter sp. A6]|uniref:Lytic murein transglycosylase B n=1 Tax=Noviluteimonas lactosilytica TaxID=2888523 RepID=A0ABS8JH94_9GAMM|nr:lytic murein transglycosylase B [Lysobacter lactosilyticus]MCC8362880.1 lytic murein transglycosylase B [Lysobacter lactosilyticus]